MSIKVDHVEIFDETATPAVPYVERDPNKLRVGMVARSRNVLLTNRPLYTLTRNQQDRWCCKEVNGAPNFWWHETILHLGIEVVALPKDEESSPEMQVVASGQVQRGAIGEPAIHPSHAKPDPYVTVGIGRHPACAHCGCRLIETCAEALAPCVPDPTWRAENDARFALHHLPLLPEPRPLPYEPSLTGYGSLVGGPFRVRP